MRRRHRITPRLALNDLTFPELFQLLAGWRPGQDRPSRHWTTWPEYFEAYEAVREALLNRDRHRRWLPFAEYARAAWRDGDRDPYESGREQYEAAQEQYKAERFSTPRGAGRDTV